LLIVLLYVLFLCKCVPYYCHRVSTQLQLTKISIYQYQPLIGCAPGESRVHFQQGADILLCQCVQVDSGSHSAYLMGTGGVRVLGAKLIGDMKLTNGFHTLYLHRE